MSWKIKLGGLFGSLLGIAFIGWLIFYASCVSYVDNYEVGYRFHGLTGQIEPLQRQGYIVTPIWDSVGTIDTRPMQVCIAANNRVLNCKLVRFNPAGLSLFLSWHGRNYGSNTPVPEHSTALAEILKSYAYDGSGRAYPFLTIIREMKTDDAAIQVPGAKQ